MRIAEYLQTQKYIAFLDVLGFKELVQEKGEKLNDYFEIIQKALQDIKADKTEIESQIVSDSIIMACEITNEKLGFLLKAAQTIQSRCALKNIWLRGAITIGDIYFNHDLNIVVGNGLVQAYLLESQEKYPRIIVNPAIINKFKTREKFVETYNTMKSTLIFQPNYSKNYIDNDAVFVTFLERILYEDPENIDKIYEFVRTELYGGQTHYRKYLWLKNYISEALFNWWEMYGSARSLLSTTMSREEALCRYNVKRFQAL